MSQPDAPTNDPNAPTAATSEPGLQPESTPTRTVETFYLPIYVLTAVFAAIFVFGPLFVRKSENRGVYRTSIMIAAFSMWLFWVTVYIAQMNPLMGPRITNTTLAWLAYTWGNPAKEDG